MLLKKYRTISLITMILLTFSLQLVHAYPKELPLLGVIITVDPGHGGRDSGTLYNDLYEKDLNLEISKKLETELTSQGAIVHMIREEDIDYSSEWDENKKRGDLYRRILMIEENESDLYLSIHINWYRNTSYKGGEVYYNNINEKNKILAQSIQSEFKNDLNSTREIKTTDLYIYSNTNIPGVLVECGYLSNSDDRYLLQTKAYQEKLSKSITFGVIEYLKITKQTNFLL